MKILLNPKHIENRSFRIISRLLPDVKLPYIESEVLKRVIHATTDLDYVKDLSFSAGAAKSGLEALKHGKDLICDVGMVRAGINKKILSGFGGRVVCFIDDKDVAKESAELKIAKAVVSMRKAAAFMNDSVIAIGNAPTALFEVCRLVKKGRVRPSLIIGVPVGFVGAEESKKYLSSLNVPYITNSVTKGGSSVAAAIVNALLKLAQKTVHSR